MAKFENMTIIKHNSLVQFGLEKKRKKNNNIQKAT